MQRVGLIGSGDIVQSRHAVGYQALAAEVEITALADVSAENRTRAGEQFEVAEHQRYSDYRDLLDHAPVDTVVIATPHAFQMEQAVAAAEAGKAIISEKPMAVTLDEADAILGAVDRHDVPYSVVHNLLHTAAVQGAMHLLDTGDLGRALLGQGELLDRKAEAATATSADWRASRRMGGGALIDRSYHEIYAVEALMNSPIRTVQARIATLKFPVDVDDSALLTFEHENGGVSSVIASWCARGPGPGGRWVTVNYAHGGIRVAYDEPAPLAILHDEPAGNGKWQDTDAERLPGVDPVISGDTTGHANFLCAAFRALGHGTPLPVTAAAGRHILAIIDAAREANATRRAVEVL